MATSNSRFVSWLVQFLSEFFLLNRNFVYFWNVKCRNYATRQSGKTLGVSLVERKNTHQYNSTIKRIIATAERIITTSERNIATAKRIIACEFRIMPFGFIIIATKERNIATAK